MTHRALIGLALLGGLSSLASAALPSDPAGQWGDKNQPKGSSDYLVQSDLAKKEIKIRFPDTIKIPSGKFATLKQVKPGEWQSVQGQSPAILFDVTGVNTAHLSIKGSAKGASWFSGWAIYIDDTLMRR